jgi:hypothetical protein
MKDLRPYKVVWRGAEYKLYAPSELEARVNVAGADAQNATAEEIELSDKELRNAIMRAGTYNKSDSN